MSRFKNAFVVTGSIGSGKSTFINLLKMHGFSCIDADTISHEELEKCGDEAVAKFGGEILSCGKIDRKKLGNIVFNDKDKLKWLENLLHPRIKDEIERICLKFEDKNMPYFVDIPLFFEGLDRQGFENIVVVYAPKNLLIERVMKRNELDFDKARKRVNLQMDIEKKRKMADFVIDNSKNLANLENETGKFIKFLKGKYDGIKI
ncbi:MAG: dephospho-CoA kinase [Campylobacter sp.]|nr:dephospho-CoA kinase [Campylobacter sp.]